MAELWYYTQDGKPMAPVASAEIQQLARDGLLKPSDMVWRDGLPAWIRADAAPELFAGPREEPIVLEPIRRAERRDTGRKPEAAKRRGWDGEGEPDIAKRRPRRDRNQQMLVLWIGLLVGGGLLLAVLVLGLLYMMMSAL
jgi:hypothetical protein